MDIQSNIPLPAARHTGAANILKALKIGDSFLLGSFKEVGVRNMASRLNIGLAFRNTDDGRRCWRTR